MTVRQLIDRLQLADMDGEVDIVFDQIRVTQGGRLVIIDIDPPDYRRKDRPDARRDE
jgi:hypothetical protein